MQLILFTIFAFIFYGLDMSQKFNEYKQFDLAAINEEILKVWEEENTFQQSLDIRKGKTPFVFYEGPPSANGIPGIHHVMARTIKDLFCRYKTQKGFLVERKAGWDTHGLPVELGVEKALGIKKEDIGKSISVEEYNAACRKDVMKYTDLWEELTRKMGYWVDMEHPYITYDNRYVETLWYLLRMMYDKGLLYKGFTIQPFSPAAGTGLSTHELNQPGCYRDVKDTTVVAQFKVIESEKSKFLFNGNPVCFLAWTTTPWTLPSNTGLAVGKDIRYLKVSTLNPYSGEKISVILAKERLTAFFNPENENASAETWKPGDKALPYSVEAEYAGSDLLEIRYEQLIPWHTPEGDPWRVIAGDFVTTEDGTGIVHIAPSFGADDFRMGKQYGLGSLTLVDRQGKFVDGCGEFSGRFVKNEYDDSIPADANTTDVDLVVMLKKENKAFKIEKYVHSYPHCWRTDKPILYYPLDSWFIKTTALKERMIELNKTINWKPESTGTGRFGMWLENLLDWNLSRSRFWGTPLPIWTSEDKTEQKCIGSLEELRTEIAASVKAGFMESNPLEKFVENDFSDANYSVFDLHRPYVDKIVLVSKSGKPMHREPDLIDVWFDSGAMPYAQLHWPFENKDVFRQNFPADFIAEGVDQTRGWFFTLHAIAVMLFDDVAYKNIISNGLVLDKAGNKMSKRLGNAVDPFSTIQSYGADPLRWYMITNAQPWDNLKFDIEGVEEVKRKFFGTLHNTYSFFALYANIDGFRFAEEEIPVSERQEIDRWIISLLNTLVKEVEQSYENYEPTRAGRLIQEFVNDNLSNWYVRLNRKRFWGGEYDRDKIMAYQTLYTCLETVCRLASPIAPFYMDKIFRDLNRSTEKEKMTSVHLVGFPSFTADFIDAELEGKMSLAQSLSSMVLSLRRRVNIKVRQPLQKIMVPSNGPGFTERLNSIRDLVLAEVNVKELEVLSGEKNVLVKKIKPDFKVLGPKYGKSMKEIAQAISGMSQSDIASFENNGKFILTLPQTTVELQAGDVEIFSEDIPGWLVANEGSLTVALDISVTEALQKEGIARELINRIQNLRKESGFEVTDKIRIFFQPNPAINQAIMEYEQYISAQTLAREILLSEDLEQKQSLYVELDNNITTRILIEKA